MILIDQYAPNELEQIVQQSNSFSEVIRKLGYTTSNGDNIKTLKRRIEEFDNAIRKWCDGYNLPRKASDIKRYSDEEWELL